LPQLSHRHSGIHISLKNALGESKQYFQLVFLSLGRLFPGRTRVQHGSFNINESTLPVGLFRDESYSTIATVLARIYDVLRSGRCVGMDLRPNLVDAQNDYWTFETRKPTWFCAQDEKRD